MAQICSPIFALVLLVVIQSVASLFEGNIGELHFTIPDERKDFDDAVSWCRNNYNSTLAVVNNSYTQTALMEFLDSKIMTPKPTMYVNIRLNKESADTWYLINGSQYTGYMGNLNPSGSWWTRYLLYSHLHIDPNNVNRANYFVSASTPGEGRNYICQYDENSCSSNSTSNIVYMGSCYVKYENESLTWYQARERCFNSGGDLATFQNDPSDKWFSPFQFNTSWLSSSSTYWVGIRYKNWSWKYMDDGNQDEIFTSWSNKKPDNYNYSCVCVDPNGSPRCSWTDCDCDTPEQFICLKRVAIQTTTTLIPTTTMNPTTTAGKTDITISTVPKLTTTTESNRTGSADESGMGTPTIIGLAVGIGGGSLIILIVLIVVLVVICKRRRSRRSKGSDGSTSEIQSVVEDSDKPENGGGVYAAVVPNGKNQGKTTEPRSEIIYTSPEFTKELNSKGHTNSSYEDANPIKEPDAISTFRGQTRSIFPQGFTDLYANADEVPKSVD